MQHPWNTRPHIWRQSFWLRRHHCCSAGASPLSCRASLTPPMQVVRNEARVQRADVLDRGFRCRLPLCCIASCCFCLHLISHPLPPPLSQGCHFFVLQSKGCSFVVDARHRGLLNAVEVDPSKLPTRCISRLCIYFLNGFNWFWCQRGTCASKWPL